MILQHFLIEYWMQLQEILLSASDHLAIFKQNLKRHLTSEVELINTVADYLINSGGKRIRPLIAILCAELLGYDEYKHFDLAVAIEFIHTATLLHDDVVDASTHRRGKHTANHNWGNEAPVLVGDFLYSRAFEVLVELNHMNILKTIATSTNVIAIGEVMQLINKGDINLSEAEYITVLRNKTAQLFAAATKSAAILAGATNNVEQDLYHFGLHFGTAYQLIDDILDYTEDMQSMGKNAGDDYFESKLTMPIIYSLKIAPQAEQEIIIFHIQNPTSEGFSFLKQLITSNNSIEYTKAFAFREINLAKEAIINFRHSKNYNTLISLCDFILHRCF